MSADPGGDVMALIPTVVLSGRLGFVGAIPSRPLSLQDHAHRVSWTIGELVLWPVSCLGGPLRLALVR